MHNYLRHPRYIFIASRTLARTVILTSTQKLFASTVSIRDLIQTHQSPVPDVQHTSQKLLSFSCRGGLSIRCQIAISFGWFRPVPIQSNSSSQEAQIPGKANSWAITGSEEASLISPVRAKHSTASNVQPPRQSGNHEEKYWLPCRVWFMVGSFRGPDGTNIFSSCRRRGK